MRADEQATALEKGAVLLAAASRVVVLTGAGISTDSGIPDFRGKNGLWTRNPKAEQASQIDVYLSDASVRAANWRAMRDMTRSWSPSPNAGHRACVALERAGKLSLLVTQNVDGLHQQAGSDPRLVVEVHGSLRDSECLQCGRRERMEETTARVTDDVPEPACAACGGGPLKASVVLFGEQLPAGAMERALEEAKRAEVLLAVGTTLSVWPVAGVVPAAKKAGAKIVIVNGGRTEMDILADVRIDASLSEALPKLLSAGALARL